MCILATRDLDGVPPPPTCLAHETSAAAMKKGKKTTASPPSSRFAPSPPSTAHGEHDGSSIALDSFRFARKKHTSDGWVKMDHQHNSDADAALAPDHQQALRDHNALTSTLTANTTADSSSPSKPVMLAGATSAGDETIRDGANANHQAESNQQYRVYKRRWFGLVALVFLNIIISWDVSQLFIP